MALKINENVLLKNFSTFKIGGMARYFCIVKTKEELTEALNFCQSKKIRFFILGGGSNVLFADAGFDGLVIRMENDSIHLLENENSIRCQAGARLRDLVKFFLEKNLSGMEWATGIPGSVGGAIRGNAGIGAGKEAVDSVKKVKVFEIPGGEIKEKSLHKEECQFDYRNSIFKENRDLLIWSADFGFEKGDKEKLLETFFQILEKRKKNQPLEYPSAGSVFQNPKANQKLIDQFEKDSGMKCRGEKVPAGWLIEQCGMKGKKIGGAKVSEKHANFIVNLGDASADDVVILISLIKQKARNLFGIQMREEIEIVL